jgi:hypothetical protein
MFAGVLLGNTASIAASVYAAYRWIEASRSELCSLYSTYAADDAQSTQHVLPAFSTSPGSLSLWCRLQHATGVASDPELSLQYFNLAQQQ